MTPPAQTILVVDDDAGARRPLMRLLRHHGYNVVAAANAYEAMGQAKRLRPDLMLLDVMIPPMDGLTLLSLLREDPVGQHVPVILITGLSDANTVSRARELGVKEHLVKSEFSTDELLQKVRQHLPHSAAEQTA